MGDWDALLLVVLGVLGEIGSVHLPPIARGTASPRHTTEIPSVNFVVIRLHIPRSTPRIRIDRRHPILPRLLAEPYLARVAAIPDPLRRAIGTSRVLGEDSVVGRRSDAVSDDGEASAGFDIEKVVETLLTGLCGRLFELPCTSECLGDAEAIDLLKQGPGVDGDLGLSHRRLDRREKHDGCRGENAAVHHVGCVGVERRRRALHAL